MAQRTAIANGYSTRSKGARWLSTALLESLRAAGAPPGPGTCVASTTPDCVCICDSLKSGVVSGLKLLTEPVMFAGTDWAHKQSRSSRVASARYYWNRLLHPGRGSADLPRAVERVVQRRLELLARAAQLQQEERFGAHLS